MDPHEQADELGVGLSRESVVDRLCRIASQVALLATVAIVGLDIFTRAVLNFSFEIADEMGGYMLVAIAFLALAVCQTHDGFHRVEFVLDRLSERGKLKARIVYDLVAMAFALLLVWYLWRFELASWESGDRAPTRLMTPLWLPQLPMVIGVLAYILALWRSIDRYRKRLAETVHQGGG